MATKCSSCGCNNLTCGCKNSYLTTPPPCPTPEGCPDPQPCSEVFDAQCITYTGVDIQCNDIILVAQNSSVAEALDSIVQYFCTATAGLVLQNSLQCPETPIGSISPAGTPVNEAIQDVVDYFCNQFLNIPTVVVEAGDGIEVTSAVVGNTTTYTVSTVAPTLRKFVKEFTSVFDGAVIRIIPSELEACGLITDSCGVHGTEFSDFTYSIFYLLDGQWISINQLPSIIVRVNDTTGDISITLDISPIEPPVRVRVVIIG